jgi:hypothetical protein
VFLKRRCVKSIIKKDCEPERYDVQARNDKNEEVAIAPHNDIGADCRCQVEICISPFIEAL